MKKLRLVLADDHPMLVAGTQLLVSNDPALEVCAVASNGRETIAEVARHHPDVVVLDFHMPDTDGLSLARAIRKEHPEVEVVIYSSEAHEEVIERLFEAGVKSFIRKTESSELLIAAIKAAGEHRPFLTPAVGEIIFRRAMGKPVESHLTPREREVVRLIAEGKSNKQIAAKLGISARTAESHRAALMRKLGFASTADVVRYAIRNGIIEA